MNSTGLIRSRFVALDSSHLGDLSRDTVSSDPERRAAAAAFERAFADGGNVLLLSWHHLQEFLSHESKEIIDQRLQFIVLKPLVATIRSLTDEALPGTIIDVQAMEISTAFRDPAANLIEVRDAAAAGMFKLITGRDLVRPFLEQWSPVSGAFAVQNARSREVVAISRSKFAGAANRKIVDLLKQAARAPGDILQRFTEMNAHLTDDVHQRGDKRIADPAQTSESFLRDVARIGRELSRSTDPALQILATMGVELSDIGPETTEADVASLVAFWRKLEIINRLLGLPWPELKARATEDRLPSSAIEMSIEKFRPDTAEWKGSDLTDMHLACLSAYADITFVDKRMHEALRQARQKLPALASILRRVEKGGNYGSLDLSGGSN